MSKNKKFKFTQTSLAEFENDLEDNEEMMGEMAALSVTCEQYGIDTQDYYDACAEFEGIDDE